MVPGMGWSVQVAHGLGGLVQVAHGLGVGSGQVAYGLRMGQQFMIKESTVHGPTLPPWTNTCEHNIFTRTITLSVMILGNSKGISGNFLEMECGTFCQVTCFIA